VAEATCKDGMSNGTAKRPATQEKSQPRQDTQLERQKGTHELAPANATQLPPCLVMGSERGSHGTSRHGTAGQTGQARTGQGGPLLPALLAAWTVVPSLRPLRLKLLMKLEWRGVEGGEEVLAPPHHNITLPLPGGHFFCALQLQLISSVCVCVCVWSLIEYIEYSCWLLVFNCIG
jgi:hypothetical protein